MSDSLAQGLARIDCHATFPTRTPLAPSLRRMMEQRLAGA